MGIDIRDPDQPVGTLSGGERQSVAIARAVHFGARVLILDEPTSALGVKQAGVVLKYILQARDRGIAVIFITHNPHHAYPVGDRFVILNRGRSLGELREVRDRQRGARPPDGGRPRARRARSTSSRASPPSSRAIGEVGVDGDPPLAGRAGHDVQVVQVVAGAGGDRVVAARDEDDVAVAGCECLVERAVGRCRRAGTRSRRRA